MVIETRRSVGEYLRKASARMRNELLEREVFHSVEKVRMVVEVSSDTKLGFETSPDVGYNSQSIKSRADALANLPDPARWLPEREMRPRTATKGSKADHASALLGDNRRRAFQCRENVWLPQ